LRTRRAHRVKGRNHPTAPKTCSATRSCVSTRPCSGSMARVSQISSVPRPCTGGSTATFVNRCSTRSQSASVPGWTTGPHAGTSASSALAGALTDLVSASSRTLPAVPLNQSHRIGGLPHASFLTAQDVRSRAKPFALAKASRGQR
jgi:hypothetical protein